METNQPKTPVALFERLLEQAKAGDIKQAVVVYETKDGSNAVDNSLPMSLIEANHLWRVFDDKVRALYRRVSQRALANRSPTAGVSPNAPKGVPQPKAGPKLARAVRRTLAKEALKAAQKAQRRVPPKPQAPPTTN